MVALRRFDTTVERCSAALALAPGPTVVLHCVDGSSVLALSALGGREARPLGVWLDVDEGYPAVLAARDVATLSWLVDLEHVVVAAPSDSDQHARVVTELLTNDEVNFSNSVATLIGAYNRPAPRHPVSVWWFNSGTLLGAEGSLREGRREEVDGGVVTHFDPVGY